MYWPHSPDTTTNPTSPSQLFDLADAARAAAAALAVREAQARAVDGAISERVAALRLVIVERDLLLRCPRCSSGSLQCYGRHISESPLFENDDVCAQFYDMRECE